MASSELLYVGLPTHLVHELIQRYPVGFTDIVEHAVESFLERTHDDFYGQPDIDTGKGVKWSEMFLPIGTELRTKYFGSYRYAHVDDGFCVYEDKKYTSIAKMLNEMRGNTMNNAWKFLEVKLPKVGVWKVADSLRRN